MSITVVHLKTYKMEFSWKRAFRKKRIILKELFLKHFCGANLLSKVAQNICKWLLIYFDKRRNLSMNLCCLESKANIQITSMGFKLLVVVLGQAWIAKRSIWVAMVIFIGVTLPGFDPRWQRHLFHIKYTGIKPKHNYNDYDFIRDDKSTQWVELK